jgi:hypothetical protein
MKEMNKKNLKREILSKGTDCIIKYNSDNSGKLGKSYFIPKEVKGEMVYGYIITPNITNPAYSFTLDSLLDKDKISIAGKFKKIK